MRSPAFITLILFFIGVVAFLIVRSFSVSHSAISPSPGAQTREVVVQESVPFTPTQPTIDKIFSNDHEWIATLSAGRIRTLVATGDVIPARSVNYKTISYGNFNWPWERTADVIRSADVTLINLESPLIENCPVTNEGMIFCGDKRHIEGLRFAGVDGANMGNNHAGNYGNEGVEETVELLNEEEIAAVGIQNPVYKDVEGLRFAFLGYNDIGRQPGVSHIEDGAFTQEISASSKQADVVVVSVHWGVEYTHEPTDRQRDVAHAMIDAGADIVIGNHPHWIQPVELYKNGVIMYAHGNFIFDQMWSKETREGVVGRYTFYDGTLIDVEFFPVVIEDYGQPRWAEGEERLKTLRELETLSF